MGKALLLPVYLALASAPANGFLFFTFKPVAQAVTNVVQAAQNTVAGAAAIVSGAVQSLTSTPVSTQVSSLNSQGIACDLVKDSFNCARSLVLQAVQKAPPMPVCKLQNDPSRCPLSSLPATGALIEPGQGCSCIVDDIPFRFQVLPGRSDKLLMYFQQGGACWSSDPNKVGTCDNTPGKLVTASQMPIAEGGGIFDKKNPINPFADYTIVNILYCSGDLHVADIVRNYPNGNEVRQTGRNNTLATLDWIFKNMKPKTLVMGGSSAGAVGVHAWSHYLLNRFRQELGYEPRSAVIVDSYASVFPPEHRQILKDYFQGSPIVDLLPAPMQAKLAAANLYACELFSYIQSQHPNTLYVAVQTKTDLVQQAFYFLMHQYFFTGLRWTALPADAPVCAKMSTPSTPTGLMSPDAFYNAVVGMFKSFTSNNFVTYVIDGSLHCFINYDSLYTANVNGVPLTDWLRQIPLEAGKTIAPVCQNPPLDWRFNCDAQLMSQSFTGRF